MQVRSAGKEDSLRAALDCRRAHLLAHRVGSFLIVDERGRQMGTLHSIGACLRRSRCWWTYPGRIGFDFHLGASRGQGRLRLKKAEKIPGSSQPCLFVLLVRLEEGRTITFDILLAHFPRTKALYCRHPQPLPFS